MKDKKIFLFGLFAVFFSSSSLVLASKSTLQPEELEYNGIQKNCLMSSESNVDQIANECFGESGLKLKDKKKLVFTKNYTFTVSDSDGFSVELEMEKSTVSDILAKAEIELLEKDEINFALEEILARDAEIVVDRARELKLTIYGIEKTHRTQVKTWEELKVELELGGEIKTIPESIDSLEELTEIAVISLENEMVKEVEEVDFETKTIYDDMIDEGMEVVVERGESGELTKTYEVKRENGVEIEKNLISEEETKEPVKRVVKIGTKKVEEQIPEEKPKNVGGTGNIQYGVASHYGYDYGMIWNGCAHVSHPKGTTLRVTNAENGKSVICIVNDWGPNPSVHPERIVDLSMTAFSEIASPSMGVANVSVEVV